jgi:formate dehydrogenase subunit gamma
MSAPRSDSDLIDRYGRASRLAHWAVAVAYVLLFASGLALFHPYFYWLSFLYGGGAFMRILHPFLGVGLFVLFFAYAARIWRENLLIDGDREWLQNALAIMMKRADVPVQGKYNAGQKLMFWSMVLVILGLMASGLFIWRPYFADLFTADTRRLANVAHAMYAFIMFVGIGVHVYAAIWTRGSIPAMINGKVTRAWARFHHPGWYRQVTEGKGKKAA